MAVVFPLFQRSALLAVLAGLLLDCGLIIVCSVCTLGHSWPPHVTLVRGLAFGALLRNLNR